MYAYSGMHYATGVFLETSFGATIGGAVQGTMTDTDLRFSASSANSVYIDGSTVRPLSLTLNYIMKS